MRRLSPESTTFSALLTVRSKYVVQMAIANSHRSPVKGLDEIWKHIAGRVNARSSLHVVVGTDEDAVARRLVVLGGRKSLLTSPDLQKSDICFPRFAFAHAVLYHRHCAQCCIHTTNREVAAELKSGELAVWQADSHHGI